MAFKSKFSYPANSGLKGRVDKRLHVVAEPKMYYNVQNQKFDNSSGSGNFTALLGQIASTRNKWAYCCELSKLYIVWHQVVPIEFRWTNVGSEDLSVRALLIYTDPQYIHESVQRCVIHTDPNDISNQGMEARNHVIRSDNPGARYEDSEYSRRSSVVVPLGRPQPGTGSVTVTYKFMCKTSCVPGLARRSMAVVFTLERANGEVLGKETMGVKVCSCPRRDMEKELHMYRRKAKVERNPDGRYQLQIFLPDLEMFKKVLELNHGGVTSLLRKTPTTDPRFDELSDFLTLLEEKL